MENYFNDCRSKSDQLDAEFDDMIELEAADAIGLTFEQFRALGGSTADWTGYREL